MKKKINKQSLSIVAFRGLAEFGDILFAIIIHVQVYNLAPSGVSVALLMLIRNLPIIVVGTFAGTVVDRMKKSNLLIACLCTMSVLILLSGMQTSMWGLLLIMGVYRVVYAFYKPARSAILPATLQKDEILECISSVMIVQEIATMAASLVVAQLFVSSVPLLLVSAVASMVLSIIIVFIFLRRSEPVPVSDEDTEKTCRDTFVKETLGGWKYLLHNRALVTLTFIVAMVWLSIGGFSSIQIVYLSQYLSLPSHWVGLSESIISIGNLIGYFIVTFFAGKVSRQHYVSTKIGFGYLLAAIMMFVSACVGSFPAFSLCLILYALGSGFSNAIEESLEQRLPSEGQVGKSISIISTIGTIGYIAGTTVFPLLTDYLSVNSVIRLASYCMLVTSLIVMHQVGILVPIKEAD